MKVAVENVPRDSNGIIVENVPRVSGMCKCSHQEFVDRNRLQNHCFKKMRESSTPHHGIGTTKRQFKRLGREGAGAVGNLGANIIESFPIFRAAENVFNALVEERK